jgi:hypothetical protein
VYDDTLANLIASSGKEADQRSISDILDPMSPNYVAPQAEMLGSAGRTFAQDQRTGAAINTQQVRNFSASLSMPVGTILFQGLCADMAYLSGHLNGTTGPTGIAIEVMLGGAWWALTTAVVPLYTSNLGPVYTQSPGGAAGGANFFATQMGGAEYFRVRLTSSTANGWIICQLSNSPPILPGVTAKMLANQGGFGAQNVQCDASGNLVLVGPTAEDVAAPASMLVVGGVVRTGLLPTTNVAADGVRHTMTTDGALVVGAESIPELRWQYATPTLGVTSVTTSLSITAKAAVAGQRASVSSLQVYGGITTGSIELEINSGISGANLWRGYYSAAQSFYDKTKFDPPLRLLAVNTAVELKLINNSTCQLYFNLQGFMSN